ncbi:MAG TPA: histidine kinase, partial [Candidatus Acidoferrales bacterium]|nr:histidine kinase [Candidatus Acidoferrales bacterium]
MVNLVWPFTDTYLRRLHAPASVGERIRVERVLGIIRVAMAALAIVAFLIDQPEPETYIPTIFTLLVFWLAHSVTTMLHLRFRGVSTRGVVYLQLLDIAAPALLSVFTHGPSTPLFAMFFFATIAASFRWGYYETLATAITVVIWLSIEAQFLGGSTKSYGQLLEGQYEINRLILHSTSLLALAFMTGRLGEDEKERRAESAVIARVLRAAYSQRSVTLILREVFGEFLRIFRASRVCLVVQDLSSGRSYVFSPFSYQSPEERPNITEITNELAVESMLPDMADTFFAKKHAQGITLYTRQNNFPRTEQIPGGELPHLTIHSKEFSSLLTVTHKFGYDWKLRLLVFNAQLGDPARELAFAESLFTQAITATHSVYLNHRMRSRAGAMERARVARELHDGVIQSLISAEIRMEVLRRRAEREQPSLSVDLSDVQQLLRKEVLELRELMAHLKVTDVGPDQLLDHMAELVERFQRETGINARFVCKQGEEIALTPQTCRELMRIVQEALVNVRRHAHASQVVVAFAHEGSGWKLA